MKLPRRVAQGQLPRAPDPALVAAGSGAVAAVLTLGAAQKVHAEYQQSREKAEYAASFHGAVSQSQSLIDAWSRQIEGTGRFMRNEAGEEVPTHTLILDSYARLERDVRQKMGAHTSGLRPANRSAIQSEVEKLLTAKRADVQQQQRELFVSDATATYHDNKEIYLGAGDYEGAAQMVSDYFDAGIFTNEQREKEFDDLQSRFSLTTAQDMLAGARTTEQFADVMAFVQRDDISATLTPQQRSTLIEKALAGRETIDDEADQQLTERQDEAAAQLESLMAEGGAQALNWGDIDRAEETGTISPVQALRLRTAKRTMAQQGTDDDQTIKWLESTIFRLSEAGDGFEPARERVVDEIYRNADQLTGQTFNRLLGEVRALERERFTSPIYSQAKEFLKASIMAIPTGFAIFADEVTAQKTDAYNAAAGALFRAAEAGGPDFDALTWAEQNVERFKTLAGPGRDVPRPDFAVLNADGSVDFAATRDALSELRRSGEMSDVEFGDATQQLLEYQSAAGN